MDEQKFMPAASLIKLLELLIKGVLYFTAIVCISTISLFLLACFMIIVVISAPLWMIWVYKEFVRG